MAPRYPIALFLLLLLAIPAFPLIRTSAEHELTARQIDAAAFDQNNAHIATDGSSFLTVWEDLGSGVLGARLDPNGVVVDTTPLVIAVDGTLPEIAWGTDRWLAVWQTKNGVSARFIERDGTMREPFEITSRQLFNGIETHLAFNGSVFLGTWLDSFNWRGRIIDPDGNSLADISLPGFDRDADVGVLAGRFYFAYAARNETNTAFLPKLTTIDASGATSAPVQIGPENVLVEKFHIAARANDLLIAWSTSRGQGLNDVLVTVAGVGAVETIAVPFKWLENIVVDQIGYLLVYGDNDQKLARRAGLAAVALFDVEAPALTIMSDTVTNNTRTVSILRRFNAFDTMGGDLYLQNFGETAVRPLAAAPRHQERPDLAAAGDVKLAVWLEYNTTARTRVNVAMRLDSSGAPLGPPIALGTTTNPYRPRVASNGTDWLVVWRTDLNVYAQRVAHDGTLLDETPLLLDGLRPQTDLDVAWDGTSYIVVWGGGVKLVISVLFAARIPATGNPSPAFIVEPKPPVPNPVIAAGPNGALIVWNFSNQTHGALLSPSDVITPLTFSVPYGYVSSIAWNKDAFLVAMRGGTPFGAELSWMAVDAFGNVRSHTAIETKYGNGMAHVSAFGEDFLLLWNDPEPHAAIIDRDGKIISGPVTIGEAVNSAVAVDGWILTAHTIGHPSRLITRVFLQTLELVANARRRSVR